jgi:branched-chain amino acid transport system substrate-binding protein
MTTLPKKSTTRRRFLIGGATSGLLLSRRPVWGQSQKPIKIGALLPVTGVDPHEAASQINGMKLYFDEVGRKVAGRPIEFLVEDDEFKPQVGMQKLRKLVESDRIDILTGPVSSGVANAVVDYVKQTNTLWVISGAALASLTREKKGPLIFRTSTTTWQTNFPLGEWTAKNLAKEIVATASDFAGGRDSVEEFKSSFAAAGGKVIKEVYPPLGSSDFSPYLADIKRAKPAAVYCFFIGGDAVNFVKQYDQFGLKAEIPLVASGFTVEGEFLPAQGRSALGVASCLHYTDVLDTPVNKAFVAAYKARYGTTTSVQSDYGYVAARFMVEALKARDGNTEDKDKLAEALRAVSFEAPRGPVRFDPATHNVIQNEYIRKAVERDGRIANEVIATFPNVRDPGSKT